MIPTLALWSLTLAALCASIFAVYVALRSSDRYLSRRLSALSESLREQSATLDTLGEQLKALRQRENMRAYRNRRAGKSEEPSDEDESPAADQRDWVHRMNEKLALSRLGVRK